MTLGDLIGVIQQFFDRLGTWMDGLLEARAQVDVTTMEETKSVTFCLL